MKSLEMMGQIVRIQQNRLAFPLTHQRGLFPGSEKLRLPAQTSAVGRRYVSCENERAFGDVNIVSRMFVLHGLKTTV